MLVLKGLAGTGQQARGPAARPCRWSMGCVAQHRFESWRFAFLDTTSGFSELADHGWRVLKSSPYAGASTMLPNHPPTTPYAASTPTSRSRGTLPRPQLARCIEVGAPVEGSASEVSSSAPPHPRPASSWTSCASEQPHPFERGSARPSLGQPDRIPRRLNREHAQPATSPRFEPDVQIAGRDGADI